MTRRISDDALVMEARRGSQRAVGDLFDRHWRAVWRASFAIARRHATAEDCAQDAFVRAFGALDGYRGPNFGAWVGRIAVNRTLNELRSDRRLAALPNDTVDPAGDMPLPDAALGRALADLTPERRAVVVLRFWLGYTPAEIAPLLDVPVAPSIRAWPVPSGSFASNWRWKMSNELEDRLAEMARLIPEPPPDATARARAAALAPDRPSLGRPHRALRAMRRPARALTAFAGVAAVVAVLAVLLIATPSDEPAPGGTGLRPDVSSLGAVIECAEPRLRVPCVEGTEPVRQGIPALAGAPWLYRLPGGGLADLDDSAPRPSLVFPAGTTYGQAVDALVVSATLSGRLPEDASLGAPLPDGAVLLQPADRDEGIALDLRAPLGYGPGRGPVFGMTLTSPADAGAGAGRTVWPRGTSVAVPLLPSCMVVRDRDAGPAACDADAQPVVRGLDPGVTPLLEVIWADAPRPPAGELTAASRRPSVADLRLPVLRADGRDTGELAIRDLRGRVVVLSFIASWCEPCSTQAPVLEDLAARFDGAGAANVVVLGVMVNNRPEPARAFLRNDNPTLQTLFDSGQAAGRALGVAAVPETVLIDRRGRVALRIPGPIGPLTLTGALDALVAEAP